MACWTLTTTTTTLLFLGSITASPLPDSPTEAQVNFDSPRSQLVPASPRHSDGTEHEHEQLTEEGVNLSISSIAAQLLSNPPEGSVATAEHPDYQPHTENQAKVVDHIKGLLNDIVTNTLVDGDNEDKVFLVDMKPGSEGTNSTHTTGFTPTILQTMFSLDSNTIKDKETIVKIINGMKENEKASTGLDGQSTTYVSVFETTEKPSGDVSTKTENDENTEKVMLDGDILGQYIAAYDDSDLDDNVAVKSVTTSTTTTTTATTTAKTTTRTTTSTTTSTTTTTTPAPTLFERAGSFVSGGIGGIVNGLSNMGNIFSQATQPFWVPLGRRKREAEETKKQAGYRKVLAFRKKLYEIGHEKISDIVKGVVKKIVSNIEEEELDDDLMAEHIAKILLSSRRPTQVLPSQDLADSSVSSNNL